MRNPRHRDIQRSYKYQEQQRVPQCFEDNDEYSSSEEEHFFVPCDCSGCSSSRWNEWISKERNSDDWISVDSADDETNNSLLSLFQMKHRYQVLNEKETSLEDKQGPQICLNRVEEDKMVEEESDWNVYHSKYVKKQMKISKILSIYNLDKQKWIDSWRNDERQAIGSSSYDDEISIINTDGFFRKNRKAGYGVIIRNRSGVPLVGSAGVYTQGKPVSALYHELQGINRGSELAIKYGLRHKVMLYCSSYLAAELVESRFRCTCAGRDHNSTLRVVCKICTMWRIPECSEEDFQLLCPLIQEIVENSYMFSFTIYDCKRRQNNAADYLAKLQLKKEEINPIEFPEELKTILYEDAQGGDLMPIIQRQRAWWLDL
ncbi:hypothetical protein MKX01_007606 [Papaver californicum]|nr:hypothetical protein MKX01_007606 [Papaver californicum]